MRDRKCLTIAENVLYKNHCRKCFTIYDIFHMKTAPCSTGSKIPAGSESSSLFVFMPSRRCKKYMRKGDN
jgi:hypothetical protein